MFARVTTHAAQPERIEDALSFVRETVMRGLEELPGFKGNLVFVDRESGKTIGISLWETDQAMQDAEATTKRFRSRGPEVSGATKPPVAETFEVPIFNLR